MQFAAHRQLVPTEVASYWGKMWLSLVVSASAESLRTENVEQDADAVSDSDVSQESWYYGEKELILDPKGAPTSGLAFVSKPGSMAPQGTTPAPLICGSSGTRSSICARP